MNNTVFRITNDNIIINKRNVINICAIISCVGLTVAKYLLRIGFVIFMFLCICSGGDSRVDANPEMTFEMLGLAILCIIAMKITIIAEKLIIKNTRKMNEKRNNNLYQK